MFDNVYWIGGGSCSGKSSIADVLGARHGLPVYHADDHWEEHILLAKSHSLPMLEKLGSLLPSQWYACAPNEALGEELDGLREEARLAWADLGRYTVDVPIIAEGVLFLPDSLIQQGIARGRAIWLIPSGKFQKEIWSQRNEWVDGVLAHYGDPDQAWDAWMNRDAKVAAHIGEDASRLNYSWVIVDGTKTIEQLADLVERHFQLT